MLYPNNQHKKWSPQVIINCLTLYAKKLCKTPSQNKVPPALRGAATYYFGSWNNAIIASNLKPNRVPEESTALHIPSYSSLTFHKARAIAWIVETYIGNNGKGGWYIALDSPDKELHQLFMNDFYQAYNYKGSNWFTLSTKVSRVCSKQIIEDISYFCWYGCYKWKLKDSFFLQANDEIICAFLQRFFDAEGWTTYESDNTLRVLALSVNKYGLTQIQILLSKIGINSSIKSCKRKFCIDCYKGSKSHKPTKWLSLKLRKCPKCGSKNIKEKIFWILQISNTKSIQFFHN